MKTQSVDRVRRWRGLLAGLHLPALALLVIISLNELYGGRPTSYFLRDPSSILDAPTPLVGMISSLGVLLWSATATICLFSARLLNARGTREQRHFLTGFGLLSCLLMLDDLFLLHEEIWMDTLAIPQPVTFAVYAGIVCGSLVWFRKTILASDFPMLLLALGFFGASICVDLQNDLFGDWHYLVEDGFKLLGITSWLAYFIRTAFDAVQLASAQPDALDD